MTRDEFNELADKHNFWDTQGFDYPYLVLLGYLQHGFTPSFKLQCKRQLKKLYPLLDVLLD